MDGEEEPFVCGIFDCASLKVSSLSRKANPVDCPPADAGLMEQSEAFAGLLSDSRSSYPGLGDATICLVRS